jgi:hypothetical protein
MTPKCNHVSRLVRLSLRSDDKAWICVDCGRRGSAPSQWGPRLLWGIGSALCLLLSLCLPWGFGSLIFFTTSVYWGWEASRG